MPYGYDVANAKLPQAADPIGSLMQGGVQGITLGLGLQRARQDAQTNQLQQQAAQLEIEKQNYDKFKRYLDMAQSPSFQSWSPQDQETIVKKVGESAIPALGIQLDMSNYKYDSKHKKLVDDLAEINNDPSLPVESKRTLSVNRINQEMYKLSKDEHEQFMKGQEFALKQPQQSSSYIFAGSNPATGDLIGINNKTFQTITTPSPTGKPLAPKNITTEMANSSLYATRANDANQQLNGLIEKGFDPTSISAGVQKLLPNYFQGENAQSLEQIGRNFGAAVLRKESGAAITKDEWEQVKLQYIPQPGDKPETLKQKAINRERAIQGLGYMGGQLPDLQNTVRSFKSESDAEIGSANLPSGTIIEINGRRARVK